MLCLKTENCMTENQSPPTTALTAAFAEQVADAAAGVQNAAVHLQAAAVRAQEIAVNAQDIAARAQENASFVQQMAARIQQAVRIPPKKGQALQKLAKNGLTDREDGYSSNTDLNTILAADHDPEALNRELAILLDTLGSTMNGLIAALNATNVTMGGER
jgi:hypothetical protein